MKPGIQRSDARQVFRVVPSSNECCRPRLKKPDRSSAGSAWAPAADRRLRSLNCLCPRRGFGLAQRMMGSVCAGAMGSVRTRHFSCKSFMLWRALARFCARLGSVCAGAVGSFRTDRWLRSARAQWVRFAVDGSRVMASCSDEVWLDFAQRLWHQFLTCFGFTF